jgi:hypothetical protein
MRIDDARKLDLATDRVIVDLFAATTSKTGLKVGRELDPDSTPKGSVVATAEMARRDIQRGDFHRAWNAPIAPSNQAIQTKRVFPDRL